MTGLDRDTITRRRFLRQSAHGAAGLLLAGSLTPRIHASMSYPFQSLDEAYAALGFNPSAAGHAVIAVAADVHYGINTHEGMRYLVDEVRAMRPRPAMLCVNGDLIHSASRHFGHVPNADDQAAAIAELRDFKADADRLGPDVPLKLTLGNHDTYVGEQDAGLFRRVFPDHPLHQSLNVAGVHVVLLNGGAAGHIDAAQRQWLTDDLAAVPRDATVLIFVHQPSLHDNVAERGVPRAVRDALAEHRGEAWLSGGHEHRNDTAVFDLPATRIVQHTVTTSIHGTWGDAERPGYWLYAIADGRVVGRIFRQRERGYRLEPPPDMDRARPIRVGFEDQPGILWQALVGEGDRQYLEHAQAADVGHWWFYIRELVYRLPLAKLAPAARQVGVLKLGAQPMKLSLAGPDTAWHEPAVTDQDNNVSLAAIPDALRGAAELRVRIERIESDFRIGGLALLGEA